MSAAIPLRFARLRLDGELTHNPLLLYVSDPFAGDLGDIILAIFLFFIPVAVPACLYHKSRKVRVFDDFVPREILFLLNLMPTLSKEITRRHPTEQRARCVEQTGETRLPCPGILWSLLLQTSARVCNCTDAGLVAQYL